MNEPAFLSDIDNTLIYSLRHPHEGWPCVERIHEKEQAYMSPATIGGLRALAGRTRFIPVTSRSKEQYARLHFPEGCLPECAVTANGADLLIGGEADPAWRRETDEALEPWTGELDRMFESLSPSGDFIRCRMVDDAYLFVYCGRDVSPSATAESIAATTKLDVIASGKKIYLLPPPLNKGAALERLRARLDLSTIIAAGDSEMDIPMLARADRAIYPVDLPRLRCLTPQSGDIFPEFVVRTALTLTEVLS